MTSSSSLTTGKVGGVQAFAVLPWGWLDSLLCPLSCLAVLLARVSFLPLNFAGASLAVLFCP